MSEIMFRRYSHGSFIYVNDHVDPVVRWACGSGNYNDLRKKLVLSRAVKRAGQCNGSLTH